MSAITGLLARDGRPLAAERLQPMMSVLAHFGSDGSASWHEGHVAVGQLLRRTTPEARYERPPLATSDGALVVVGDVRLDNRPELIRALGLDDRPIEQVPDGQLVLAAYERWGDSCPEHLLGDFAFAVWDSRRRAMFCARDHFGVRPFYYYLSSHTFAFASAIKGLLALDEVPRTYDELRVAEHLTATLIDKERTFYRAIQRLRPGHWMRVGTDEVTGGRYFALDPSRELRLRSSADYGEAVRAAFIDAVRCRLRAERPIGAMLSGGMDSSSIVCVARALLAQEGPTDLRTYSAIFDTVRESDERSYMAAVVEGGGIKPHYLKADSMGPLVDLEQVLWHQDEALYAGNLYIHWCAYRRAAEDGVSVVLDGFDGDSTISHGLGYFPELALAGRWLRLAREIRAFSLRANKEPWLEAVWLWYRKYRLNPALGSLPLSHLLRRLVRRQRPRLEQVTPPAWARYLNPAFVERTGLVEIRRGLPRTPVTEREQHFRLLDSAGEPYVLEILNRAAAAFGVEVRFPFWDRRLVELCLSLPAEQKIHHGWTRMVMRRAMEGLLPEQIRWRGHKSDLGPGFDHGFITYESPTIERILFDQAELIEPFVNIGALRAAYGRYQQRQASESETLVVWRAVTLGLWLEHVAAPQTKPG